MSEMVVDRLVIAAGESLPCEECGGSELVKTPNIGSGWNFRMDRDPQRLWPNSSREWCEREWDSYKVVPCVCVRFTQQGQDA